MLTQTELTRRLDGLNVGAYNAYQTVRADFGVTLAQTGPTQAIDRHALELAESQEFLAWTTSLKDKPEQVPALLSYLEMCLLRGDWQPRSSCPIHNALNQAKNLARCKLIKRLRAILTEGSDADG